MPNRGEDVNYNITQKQYVSGDSLSYLADILITNLRELNASLFVKNVQTEAPKVANPVVSRKNRKTFTDDKSGAAALPYFQTLKNYGSEKKIMKELIDVISIGVTNMFADGYFHSLGFSNVYMRDTQYGDTHMYGVGKDGIRMSLINILSEISTMLDNIAYFWDYDGNCQLSCQLYCQGYCQVSCVSCVSHVHGDCGHGAFI